MGLHIHAGHIGLYGHLCTSLMPRCDATDNLLMFDNKQEPIYLEPDFQIVLTLRNGAVRMKQNLSNAQEFAVC